MNLYADADRAVKEMNRLNLKLFGKLKLSRWDELNVIRNVSDTYDQSARFARRMYFDIAVNACGVALREAGTRRERVRELVDDTITAVWLLNVLDSPDPVTMYSFDAETARKKQRLTEALAVASNRNLEIDKALRNWTRQVAQYADNMVPMARLEAFEAVGVEAVRWVSQDDNKVCADCNGLDGRIFTLDELPQLPQHYHCRCYVIPAF